MQDRDTTTKISIDRRLLLGASAAAVLGASRALAQPAPATRPAEPLPGGKKLAQLIAEYVAGFDLKNVPPEVIRRARVAFIDTMGVMLAGRCPG